MRGGTHFKPNPWVYLGLFFISASILHLEMVQMRIFSLALWHHLAYLVITIALLGFGASGTLIAIFPGVFIRNSHRVLHLSSSIFAVTICLAFWVTSSARLDTFKLLTPSGIAFDQLALLFLYYGVFVIPFIAAGVAVTICFAAAPERSYGLYFTNLCGSAAGVILFSVTIGLLGGERSIILGCVLAGVAGLCFSLISRSRIAITSAVCLLLALCLVGSGGMQFLEPVPAPSKAYGMYLDTLDDFRLVSSRWNPISRIDVIASKHLMLPWLPDDMSYFPHMAITIDGDATTWMWHFGVPAEEICGIEEDLYSAAYHTKENPEVMVIGLGGGNDIRTALHFEAKRVVGVEINPLIADLLLNRFPDFIDNICHYPGVEIHVAEGRSYARRTSDTFDILQMSGVDTWSGLSSGAYVLSENYLYTLEAFDDYLSRLKPGGVLAVNRWYFDPPREMLRMVAVGMEALRSRGHENPWDHVIVVGSQYFCATLFKSTPWTAKEIATYDWYARMHDEIEVKYSPGIRIENPFTKLAEAFREGTEARYYDDYVYNIEPVTDDNPFFFDYYKWKHLPRQIFSSGTGGQIGANWPIAMALLVAMLIQTGLLVLLFIFLPLVHFQRRGLQVKQAARLIGYFLCLGLGYIFVEIVFMQKLVLYLGHPILSISVVLTGLLFFSGLGSLAASILPSRSPNFLPIILGLTVCVLLGEIICIPMMIKTTLAMTLSVRIVLTLCVLAPAACLMGIPFPAGLVIIGKQEDSILPWAWGANGGATVLGSVLSIILAMNSGFSWVLLTGALLYGVALILFWPFKPQQA
jgi:spermidine synthase